VLAAAATHVLQAVGDPSAGQPAQPFERQRRTRPVAAEPLSRQIITRLDAHARVHVEAVVVDGEHGLVGSVRVLALGGVSLAIAWQGRDRASAHGEGGAGVERRLHGRLVGAPLVSALVEVAVAAQPRYRATLHAAHDREKVGARRRGRAMEAHARDRGSLAREDAVEDEHVEVNVQVEAAEALHEGDRAAGGVRQTLGLRPRR
jgi:hypothetical protein